jgi:hypothetical protein
MTTVFKAYKGEIVTSFNRPIERLVTWPTTCIEMETCGGVYEEDIKEGFYIDDPVHSGRTITSVEVAEEAAEELFDEIVTEERMALEGQFPKAESIAVWLSLLTEE